MINPIYQGAFPGTIENGRVPLPSRLRDIYEDQADSWTRDL